MSTLEHHTESEVAADNSLRPGQPGAQPQRARAAAHIPPRPGAEHYDTLLWRLCARRPDALDASFLLGLVGCGRQAGVSTVATNLAIRAADHGLGPVLLVDANVAHPHLHRLWKLKPSAGLADVLAGQAALEACLQTTSVAGLDLLPFGDARRLDQARIDPLRFEGVVSQMREQYSLVICDLPEARDMGHALLLAGVLDGALVVVRSERVGRHAAQQTINRLASDGVNMVGAVITDHRHYLPNWLNQRL
jgi:Mrp family chromosome partitioning ATPase